MARIDGARGIAYMAIASGAAASPVAFVSDWTVSVTATRTEVTPLGAIQKSWIAGVTEFSGDFSGWYDDATSQTYIAATDGVPRNFYLYPNTQGPDASQFFYGMILPDFAVGAGVQEAAAVKCSWSAAGAILRSPADADLQDEAWQDILDQAYGVMS